MKIKIIFSLVIFCLIKISIQQGDKGTNYIVPSAFYFDHDIFMNDKNYNCYFIDFLNFVVYDFDGVTLQLKNLNLEDTNNNLCLCCNDSSVSMFGDDPIDNISFYSKYNRDKERIFNDSIVNFYDLKKNYQFIYMKFDLKNQEKNIMIINKDKDDLKTDNDIYNDNSSFIVVLQKDQFGYSFRHQYKVYYLAGFFGYILIFFGLFMIVYGFNHPSVPFLFLPIILSAKIFLVILDLVVVCKRVINGPKIGNQDVLFGTIFALFVIIGLVVGILFRNNTLYRKIIIGIFFGYILYIIFFYIIMKTRDNYNTKKETFQLITVAVRLLITLISMLIHIIVVKPKDGNVLPEKFLIAAMSIIGSYLFISGITYLGGGIPILLEFGIFPRKETEELKNFNNYAHSTDSVILLVIFLVLSVVGFIVMIFRKPVKVVTTEGEEISRVLKDSDNDKKKFDDEEDEEISNDDD